MGVHGLVSDAGSFPMSLKGLVLSRLIGVVPMVEIPWSESRSDKKLKFARPWSTCCKSFSHRGDGSVTSLTVSFGLHGANHSSTWSGAQHR